MRAWLFGVDVRSHFAQITRDDATAALHALAEHAR
jgi:hypothetical protein